MLNKFFDACEMLCIRGRYCSVFNKLPMQLKKSQRESTLLFEIICLKNIILLENSRNDIIYTST